MALDIIIFSCLHVVVFIWFYFGFAGPFMRCFVFYLLFLACLLVSDVFVCRARLFQTLANQRELTEVQALLLGRVSLSCFLPQDCTAGKM